MNLPASPRLAARRKRSSAVASSASTPSPAWCARPSAVSAGAWFGSSSSASRRSAAARRAARCECGRSSVVLVATRKRRSAGGRVVSCMGSTSASSPGSSASTMTSDAPAASAAASPSAADASSSEGDSRRVRDPSSSGPGSSPFSRSVLSAVRKAPATNPRIARVRGIVHANSTTMSITARRRTHPRGAPPRGPRTARLIAAPRRPKE